MKDLTLPSATTAPEKTTSLRTINQELPVIAKSEYILGIQHFDRAFPLSASLQ
jgi:hypothetical protein